MAAFQSLRGVVLKPSHVAAAGLLLAAAAAAQPPATIEAMATIPSQGIKVVESEGRLLGMSSNGRFVFKGEIYDAWSLRALQSIAEVNEAINTIDLKKLKLDIDALRPLDLGKAGAPAVVIFVDPHCPYCKELLTEAQTLLGEFRFRVLAIGILGQESARDARLLGCASDRSQAQQALLSQSYADLEQLADCDLDPMRRALVTAQVFGVEGVPFLIAPDGSVQRGSPPDLKQWLAVHRG